MNKKLVTLIAAVGLAFSASNGFAQSWDEGKSSVTVGYGFPNLVTATFRSLYNTSNHTGYTFQAMGPIIARYEYGLSEKIGFGLVLGYSSMSLSYNYEDYNSNGVLTTYTEKLKWSSPTVGGRMSIHFATKDKLDPYFGVSAGWSGNTFTWTDNNPNNTTTQSSRSFSPFYFGLGVGMRYYFTENIGLYVEFGWDKWALMQAGLALKF